MHKTAVLILTLSNFTKRDFCVIFLNQIERCALNSTLHTLPSVEISVVCCIAEGRTDRRGQLYNVRRHGTEERVRASGHQPSEYQCSKLDCWQNFSTQFNTSSEQGKRSRLTLFAAYNSCSLPNALRYL